MPELKLTYFDFPGRAEAARLALAIGGHSFIDERLIYDEYLVLYSDLPYGSLPILTVDNQVYAQSAAILRYCGRISNLYPEDALQAARVDEIIDTILDFVHGLEDITEPEDLTDESVQLEHVEKYLAQAIPRYIGGIEKRAQQFGKGPWLVNDHMSIADLAIYVCIVNLSAGAFGNIDMQSIQTLPRIHASFNAVKEHPKVQEWNEYIEREAQLVKDRSSLKDVPEPDESK